MCHRPTLLTRILMLTLLLIPGPTSALDSSVPIDATLAGSLAASLFPVTVPAGQAKVHLTEPAVLFLDSKRMGIRVRFQAYDHRPEQGVAISETGWALLSGEPDYDADAQQVLLYRAELDQLDFDRDTPASRGLERNIRTGWAEAVTDPLRAKLPPHPYLLPFRENIGDIHYDGNNITILLVYR